MKKYILFLFLIVYSFAQAKDYTLYLASTKHLYVAKEYYKDIKFHTPDFYDVIIRDHIKNNYSVIIRKIPNIEKAKKIQKLFFAANKYNDSYIKAYEVEPTYNIIKIENNFKETPIINTTYEHDIENTNEYITASVMYNTGQYDRAYEMFNKLFLKENYNLNINYFLAKSAFNTKKYDEATAAFERVLILKPDYNQARYDYARILYKLKQKEEAKKEFTTLLESPIKEETKKDINKYLKVLNRKKNKPTSISANMVLGFGRSSNVNNGLISPIYRIPGGQFDLGEDPIADSFHFQALNLNFFNYFKRKPIRIKNSFTVYNKTFFNEKDENLVALSYKPSIQYYDSKNKVTYGLELGLDKIIKKSDEDLYAFSISPQISTSNLFAFLKFQRILYDEDENGDTDNDFEKIQLYTKVNLFKNMNYYVNLYKNMERNDRPDIDKYTIGNGVNIFYDITEDNRINLNYEYEYSKYKNDYHTLFDRRKDNNHLVELTHTYKIESSSSFATNISYIKNNSNHQSSEYDEKAIRFNYLKAFRW